MNKIEDTKKYFIQKHGEPGVKIENGVKVRFINSELSIFEKLIEVMSKASEILNYPLNDSHIKVLCDFSKCEIETNKQYAIAKIERLIKEWENKVNFGKKNMIKLLKSFEEFSSSEDYDPRTIMNLFVEHIKSRKLSHKENYKTLFI